MPRLFALADLHLSGSGAKPMDRFGELWVGHAARMAEAWDGTVAAGDTVLVPGDISWARDLAEAGPDLAWLAARPGRKLLLRGNHDSWWASAAKLRRALPEGCAFLQNDAVEVDGLCVVGARGWTAPGDPYAVAGDEAVWRRELGRLDLSLAAARGDRLARLPRIAMTHYPPTLVGRPPGEVVERLRAAEVRIVVYGHLHGEDHRLALRGEHHGMEFVFVAADAVGFRPVELAVERLREGR